MVKGGKESLDEDSTKPKPDIIGKGIVKKNGRGKKLEGVLEAVSSFAVSARNDEFAGYIFLCNGRTKPECFSYRVFGLPSFRIDIVARIKPNTKLFLFDFDVKLLYGVYSATSPGTMNLEPLAFGGRFPAQVRFEIFKECMPIPESKFKIVIKDNYQGSKFRQNLNADQVDGLISLFQPLLPPPSASPASLLSNETQSRKILLQEIEKQSRSPTSLLSNEIQARKILNQEIEKQSRSPTSLLSNEIQARKILLQEIEKQSSTPDISAASQQPSDSQYVGSRFGHSSYYGPPSSLPLYGSERPLTSMSLGHERTSVPSQLYPSSRLLPYDNLYRPELPRHSYFTEYSASTPNPHYLSSGYPNGPLLSGIEVNHRMGLRDDYYIYQNIGQGHALHRIPQQISAPPCEPNKAPSSVLAAAYWAAVANEIPQPGVHQTSDSGQNEAGKTSTSLQYKPPNLTSQSLLDAYWEAKALEDSRQAHLGSSSDMLLHSTHQPMSTIQRSMFPVAHAYGHQNQNQNQNHPQHPNQLPALNQGGDVFSSSNSVTQDGNQVATYASGIKQQVAEFQMQHGPPYHSTYTL